MFPKYLFVLSFIVILFISFFTVAKYTNNFVVTFDIKIIQNDYSWRGELFYSSSKIFKEKTKRSIRYKSLKNEYQKIEININNIYNINAIRLDPLLANGTVEIKNFFIKYKDQKYKVDFSKIEQQNDNNNIAIIAQSSGHIVLECVGDDPYIELVDNINFNIMSQQYISSSLFLTLILYLLLLITLWLVKLFTFEYGVLVSLLIIYTWYTLLFSTWEIAYKLILAFSIASVLVTIRNGFMRKIDYFKGMFSFLLIYFLMSYASIFLSSHVANLSFLNSKVLYIIASCFIPIGFYNLKNINTIFFKTTLTFLVITTAFFIILLNSQLVIINDISIFNFIMHRSNWTQKNYIFWYIILTFGTLSFYKFKERNDFITILVIFSLAYYAIFNSYSQSAALALVVATIVYLVLSLATFRKVHLNIFIWILTLSLIFTPLLSSLIDLAQYHPRLVDRDALYYTATALIKEHWFFGYGFGSTLHLHTSEFINISNLSAPHVERFDGGHPHNISLLFWLEFGVFGAAFLGYYVHKLLRLVIDKTQNRNNQPALFAMIISFIVITSLSWSIWYPQVLLTYAFFGVMLVLSMNTEETKHRASNECKI